METVQELNMNAVATNIAQSQKRRNIKYTVGTGTDSGVKQKMNDPAACCRVRDSEYTARPSSQ